MTDINTKWKSQPDLKPLDMHGVDDAGVYFPPSLARYEEMNATRDVLERRVTELQARGTELENERRMWKARAMASSEILHILMVDLSIAQRMMGAGVLESEARAMVTSMFDVHQRNELLEKDAWCKAAQVTKEFVSTSRNVQSLDPWIKHWVERFKEALR